MLDTLQTENKLKISLLSENTVIRKIFIYKELVFVLYIADSSCTD